MKRVIIAAMILALAVPAMAATRTTAPAVKAAPKPAFNIPTYPGSIQIMEVSIDESNMLDWFKNVLPALASMSAGSNEGLMGRISKLDFAGLAQALQGLKQVKVVEYSLPKSAANSTQKVLDYYTAQLQKENNWTRVFWKSDEPGKAMAVYSQPNAEGVFIASVKSTPEGGKLIVGRTAGRVDLAKVTEWAAKNLPAFIGGAPQKSSNQ